MAVDPQSNGSIIYISASGKGLFKSLDSGETWTFLPSSPVVSPATLPAIWTPLAVDPMHEGAVYYGTDHGLYISKDGGSTWSASTNGFASTDTQIEDVAFDPLNQDSVFVLAGAAFEGGGDLYESTDGGNSWALLSTNLDALRVIPSLASATTLYLSGFTQHSVYASTDGGRTFSPSDSGMAAICPPAPNGYQASSRGTILPLSGLSLLATDISSGVFRSENAGQSWSPSSTGLSAYNGMDVTVDPENPNTIYFAAANDGGIFKSTDDGSTWTNVFCGSTHAVAVDPFHSSHILGAAYNYGLVESNDGGSTWQTVSSLPSPPIIANGPTNIAAITFSPTVEGTIYISTALGGAGILKSTDDGTSYNFTGFVADTASRVVTDPGDPNVLFAGTGGGLYKSTDGGATWSQKLSGMAVTSISIDIIAKPVTIYAGGSGLSKSTDLGETWVTIQNPPATAPVLVDPSTANSIFVLNYWSPDGGDTWVPLTSGTSGLGSMAFILSNGGLGEAIATSSPQTLFIASWVNSLWRFPIGP